MIHNFCRLLALLLGTTCCVAQQAGSITGGFVGTDAGDMGPPSFRASGVQGSTAPSGYSAGASAEAPPIVVPGSGTREDCTPIPIPHVSTVRLAQRLSFAADKETGHLSYCHVLLNNY